MSDKIDLRILELLTSRLCHDLISPVSAVGNGLELLEESASGLDDDALALCMDSQKRAAALLQSFRMAFGAGQVSEQLDDARRLAMDILHKSKVRLDWSGEGAPDQPPQGAARLVLNMVMLAAECLPRGGFARVRFAPNAIEVTAEGQDPKAIDELAAALQPDCPAVALTPRTVQAFFAGRLAERIGGRLGVMAGPGTVTLRAKLTSG
jgi:histidine phosphotransferase ChpT